MTNPDGDDEFHAESQTLPTACTYSGFADEPSVPMCHLPAVHSVRCRRCGALIARCAQHGGARGTRLLLAHHEARCGVAPSTAAEPPADDIAIYAPTGATYATKRPPADEDDDE